MLILLLFIITIALVTAIKDIESNGYSLSTSIFDDRSDMSLNDIKIRKINHATFELIYSNQTENHKRQQRQLCTYGCWYCGQACHKSGAKSWCCNGDRCCCSPEPEGAPCLQATRGNCPNSFYRC